MPLFGRLGQLSDTESSNFVGAVKFYRLVRSKLYAATTPSEILNMLKVNPAQLREDLTEKIEEIVDNEAIVLPQAELNQLIDYTLNDLLGLGPIEPLLKDPLITEVMVNGPYMVFIEKDGRLEKTDVVFEDVEHVMNVINRIVAPIGRRVDESSPMVDARLADGSRVNVIIPPLALSGPTITIRKFRKKVFSMEELVNLGTLTTDVAELLNLAVKARLNIIVTGGTSSGKTALLNALSSLIPTTERIITIEDSAELRFNQPHVVSLESRPANIEGRGQVTIRDLVINALRMRPDRLVVGEVRSGETLDMLQAMNTGHSGSLTTAHANSPREAILRLETMALMAGIYLPVSAVREQIASAVDIILHVSKMPDGSRKLIELAEVDWKQDGNLEVKTVVNYRQKGVSRDGKTEGCYWYSGKVPNFARRFNICGFSLPWFFKENKGCVLK